MNPVLEPVPLDTVSADTFAPHVGSAFSVTLPVYFPETDTVTEQTLTLRLSDVRRRAEYRSPLQPQRTPFALTFVGPTDIELSQHIYPLHHADAGLMEIFLVPIGADAEGRTYEAVFN